MESAATDDLSLARAVDDLRRGVAVGVAGDATTLAILPAEFAHAETLGPLEAAGRAELLLSPARAASLKLLNQRAAAGAEAVFVTRASWLDLVASLAAADPVADLATPFKGPFPTRPAGPDAQPGAAAIALLKRAGLLPAAFVVAGRPAHPGALTVAASAVLAWRRAPRLRITSRSRLPLAGAESCHVVAFRPHDGGPEHLALLIGTPGDEPLVRLHSACLTGDVLGSLKCDCGPQLHAAITQIAAAGGGILLYLQQEGRGIGLLNKLRAYALQDQGFDTVDANLRLGFEAEERDFDLAAAMLRALDIGRIRLLTNNPAKIEALEAGGIRVAARVPLAVPENPYNARYLATKRDRQGHQL
jgi:GTP cyclohydrolase II